MIKKKQILEKEDVSYYCGRKVKQSLNLKGHHN